MIYLCIYIYILDDILDIYIYIYMNDILHLVLALVVDINNLTGAALKVNFFFSSFLKFSVAESNFRILHICG